MAELGAPGTWWTGTERVAIAGEVRRAMAHSDLPPWEAPSSIDGMIDDQHPLPTAAVDAVWRITNHSGTLTQDWYDEIVASLASPEHYVELVGIVARMNANGSPGRARWVSSRCRCPKPKPANPPRSWSMALWSPPTGCPQPPQPTSTCERL